ncbi:MAG: aminoacyl-histidine dipeptidase [Bacteroidales bacterium]|jgi:dipeptidase D|nr:aminoacyl-histidine dipeptidase [Bacteroidales bacterium]
MSSLRNLKPENVFYYFGEICKIPRPSKKEGEIREWLLNKGKELGLATKQDAVGNVLISKPATPGREAVTPVIFQSHMDMVCEKNTDTQFDFSKDSIQTEIEGDWLTAKGTTLGADDGIGMAIALAILADKSIEHGPIECLFTVDEETGLTGAAAIEPGFMTGKILLNLDSEEWGEFCIGCAGGKDTIVFLDIEHENIPENSVAYKLILKGLKGGHSGCDIHLGRGNSIKLLNRVLWNAYQDFDVRVAHFDAGNLHNAIPREGYAVITVPQDFAKDFENYVQAMNLVFKEEFHTTDPEVELTLEPATMPGKIWEEFLQIDFMNAVYVCPHGVQAMSQDIPGFVESSTNLASVKIVDNKVIKIVTSQRSSVESKKQAVVDRVTATFSLIGAQIEHGDGYPGWTPNPKSKALALLKETYERLFNQVPEVKAIHAGLECGLFSTKYPDMDMVSYGPTLFGVHSPDEKMLIPTVQKCWDLTVEFLKSLK